MRYTETCFKHNDGKHVLDLQEAVIDTFLFAIFKKKLVNIQVNIAFQNAFLSS